MTTTTLDRAELAARRVAIDEQIERLEQEKLFINMQIRDVCALGNNDAGDFTIQLRANKRLDTAALEAKFPITQYPHLYAAKISTPAVRKHVAPVDLLAFEAEGEPSVIVK